MQEATSASCPLEEEGLRVLNGGFCSQCGCGCSSFVGSGLHCLSGMDFFALFTIGFAKSLAKHRSASTHTEERWSASNLLPLGLIGSLKLLLTGSSGSINVTGLLWIRESESVSNHHPSFILDWPPLSKCSLLVLSQLDTKKSEGFRPFRVWGLDDPPSLQSMSRCLTKFKV